MPIRNQRGQMAIFIALFFQVLFVFFAMAINVGLVVHDKINLQNAVDLAAYYGAAKQAEILNQIAHVNYQMRQNYKLFVWRYRVLGTLGNERHPLSPLSQVNGIQGEGDASGIIAPTVCVSHPLWQEFRDLDGGAQFCREPNMNIPNIRVAQGGSGFVPGYDNLRSFTEQANLQIQLQCRENGIFNWLFAARILVHFRIDGLLRKNKIQRLASNLSSQDFRDIMGESVQEGVRKTFEFNLTEANRQSIDNFQYFNSMTSGQCANPEFWLPEVRINPVIMFTDFQGSAQACNAENIANRMMEGRQDNLPNGFNDSQMQAMFAAPNQTLIEHWQGEPNATSGLHSSIGFEKNPWCLVYSGVQASTSVRKPFSPTGGVVRLQARGFAQPFGGRIGPWYGRSWPQGAPNSQASNPNEMVDPLLPSRDVSGAAMARDPQQEIANLSRFPGDTFGYNSLRTQSATPQLKQQLASAGGNQAPLAWATYNHLGGRPSLEQTGDSMARASQQGVQNPAPQRDFEVAATAPDAFDALYYSVEPSYFHNYFGALSASGGALFNENEKIYDFGSTKDSGHPGTTPQFSIRDQLQRAQQLYDPGYEHFLKNWTHLLTSWHQRAAVDFTMDPERFGQCQVPVSNDSYPTTGNCIQGGRTGYSVKNVSRDFLISGDHALGGGPQGQTGSLLNPPNF